MNPYEMVKKYKLHVWRDYAEDHEIKWHVGIPVSEADPGLIKESTLAISDDLDNAIMESVAKIGRP